MMKKLITGFLLSTALLVASEYIFLQEIFSQKRVLLLASSLSGIALAGFFFFLCFMRYHKLLKDS
jgi:hypothetical protein